jgi:hypothetical protein
VADAQQDDAARVLADDAGLAELVAAASWLAACT